MNFKNNYMIVQCPFCLSENVTNLSLDSNDFICNDCGEDFKADNGIDPDNDEQGETSHDASFIDFDPKAALIIAKQLRKENEDDNIKE
jgi:hypothetical protein